MRGRIDYAGAALLGILGVLLYTVDADFQTAGTPILALPLVVAAALIWGALALRRRLAGSQGEARARSHREDD